MIIYIASGIFGFCIIWAILINNQIVVKKNRIEQAFGSIDAYLKQRFDLLPNLIASINKYLEHERGLLAEVTSLRSKVENATSSADKVRLSNEMNGIIANIAVENYPYLKADKQFIQFQYTLTEIEELLSASRRAYNAAIIDYNNKIGQFPANLIASIRKDSTEKVLEIPDVERKNVDVSQLFSN